MNEAERVLLRRRKQYIAESIELTDELLGNMRQSGLLSDDTVAMLQVSCTFIITIIVIKIYSAPIINKQCGCRVRPTRYAPARR